MRRSAFTILEVILVLTIIIIVGAIGWPSIEAMQADFRVNAAADQIRGAWAEARARAAEDNFSYRFAVIRGTGQYRIAPDAGEFWDGDGGSADLDLDRPPLVLVDELPQGVIFSDANGGGSGGWESLAHFQSDGSADRDVEIIFSSGGIRPMVLRLRGLTGAVTAGRVEN